MIRRHELELTVGTLRIALSVRLSGERLYLPKADLRVKGNHLVIQVKNATAVRYTKRNGGHKPDEEQKKGCKGPCLGCLEC